MPGLIDPYHWDGPVTVDEDPEMADVMSGPALPWDHFTAIAFAGTPLREHFGPGNHKSGSPQSSHSKGAGAGDVANTAAKMVDDITTQGGTSLRTAGTTPSSGIMVSYPPGSGHNTVIRITRDKAAVQAKVEAFVASQRDFVTSHSDRFLGGWVDSGKLHLDVSRNIPSSRRQQAIDLGRRNNQIAVFDLDTFTEIPTGGTGA